MDALPLLMSMEIFFAETLGTNQNVKAISFKMHNFNVLKPKEVKLGWDLKAQLNL